MSNCCHPKPSPQKSVSNSCGSSASQSIDWLFWVSLVLVVTFYLLYLAMHFDSHWLHHLTASVYELVNTMYLGVIIAIVMIGVVGKIPREFVLSLLGKGGSFSGLLRATAAGVLLDLCSHGILMVGAKLYDRGASIGQVMAFIIASPWNSFSLTIILISLIGLGWTLLFIVLSMLIALISGIIFDKLVERQILPANPATVDIPTNFLFLQEAKRHWQATRLTPRFIGTIFMDGIKDSKMVLRWLLFGVLLASAIRAFVPTELFQTYFGPTLIGLSITILVATVLEVCSEGSAPVAADILNRAQAPGNGFAFLMGGVSTDYTEIMVIKDTTASWKIALFLPLITLPQIFLIAMLINL